MHSPAVQRNDDRKAAGKRSIPGKMDPETAVQPLEGKGMIGILNRRGLPAEENKGE